MSLFWAITLLTLTVTAVLAAGYMTKPRRLPIYFTKVPPVMARVNTPSKKATEKQRTINLPTGDNYVIPLGVRGHFVMVFDWRVSIEINGKRHYIVVPKLSTTDFASIPRVLHTSISPLNNTIYSAILHDYLYRNPEDFFFHALPRKTIDRIFYWGMRVRGVKRVTAGIMYLGVRIGGVASYQRIR